jgi:hypothetical protein
MKRSRFTEDQIIGMLKEHEAGMPVADWRRLPCGVCVPEISKDFQRSAPWLRQIRIT